MFCRQTPRGPYGPVLGLLLGWSKNGLKVATLVAVKCCDDDQFRAFCCATKLSDMEVLPSLGHWLARRDRPAGKKLRRSYDWYHWSLPLWPGLFNFQRDDFVISSGNSAFQIGNAL